MISTYRRPRQSAALALVGLTLTGLPGCRSATDDGGPAFSQRDSAGIHIAESRAPLWTAESGWTVGPAPLLVVGQQSGSRADSTQLPLLHVGSLLRLAPNEVVFADGGTRQLIFIDTLGSILRRFGGKGGGPGEFQRIGPLFHCAGDTIIVDGTYSYDVFQARTGFVRRVRPPSGVSVYLRGISGDCQTLVANGARVLPPIGMHGYHRQALLRLDRMLRTIDTVRVDSLAAWTRTTEGGGPLVARLPPWNPDNWAIAHDSAVITGFGGRPELRWYLTSGLRRIVRWNQPEVAIGTVDRRLYEEKRRRLFARVGKNPESELIFPELGDFPELPRHKPFFDGFLVDGAGNVWVRKDPLTLRGYENLPPVEPIPDQAWLVLDSAGRWLGEVTMPHGFVLRDVGEGRVWGVHRDSLDVETVRAYPLLAPDH